MTISQRATTHSDTEDLDRDAECMPDVATIKRTTAVELTRRVYIGDKKYHAVLGCVQGKSEEATIATAIEQRLCPCKRCQPPDYREGTTAASNEAITEDEQAHDKDDANQHVSADNITISLPVGKPTQVGDIDPFVCSQGDIRRTAHIPANGGDQPEPLCVVAGTYNSPSSWEIKSQAAYPDPSAWFDLCTPCLVAYDRVTAGETRAIQADADTGRDHTTEGV
jgi:hypothetical protein